MAQKWVYAFEEGDSSMRNLLGRRGCNRAEMTHIGLPIPPGFIITTEACVSYINTGKFPENMWQQVVDFMSDLNQKTGKEFGSDANPLLISILCGARESMPGMMEPIPNVGLIPGAVKTMGEKFGDECSAWDLYCRQIQMFSKVVLDVPSEEFEDIIQEECAKIGVLTDQEMTTKGWQCCAERFMQLAEKHTGAPFPEAPYQQLKLTIEAAFKSWNSKRAIDFRNRNHLNYSHTWGTAVNVVTMVYGNLADGRSGTGVVYTRNPVTGEKKLWGGYLLNALEEDILCDRRVPHDINKLAQDFREAFNILVKSADILEHHFGDAQNIEFTLEAGNLWILGTRKAKGSAPATFRIAVDLVEEGLISKDQALRGERLTSDTIRAALRPRFDPVQEQVAITRDLLARGLSVSPGAATGQLVFDSDTARRFAKEKKPVILVRPLCASSDMFGLVYSVGLIGICGGATSEFAIVARQIGKPYVVGFSDVEIDPVRKELKANNHVVKEGDWISINGSTGYVFVGRLEMKQPQRIDDPYLSKILSWADKFRKLKIWADADDSEQLRQARGVGAEGIGLCRTEPMFLGERAEIFQQVVLAESEEIRQKQLAKLQELQVQDFCQIFEAGDGLPIVIRLLDPPLYEFLPEMDELWVNEALARARGETEDETLNKLVKAATEMAEFNPLLGLRGSRVAVVMPGIYQMQIRAIFSAACEVKSRSITVVPQILLPMISHVNELEFLRKTLENTAQQILANHQCQFEFKIGCMIEIPRAALTAAEIAQVADFFSFDTNDLTQMTFGISRDDAERHFLLRYIEKSILPTNPFQIIDKEGVGKLMSMAVNSVRQAQPSFEIGVCGEQTEEPDNIELFHKMGLDYISTRPLCVPIARLAAAQTALKVKENM